MDMWNALLVHSKQPSTYRVEGKRGPRRPQMSWKQLTERDCREWKLSAINPHDRNMWRSGASSAMRSASQLSLMWMLPLYLQVNQKTDYDMMSLIQIHIHVLDNKQCRSRSVGIF